MLSSSDIRKRFIRFFQGKGHKVVASAPMVLRDDPTLLFVNSGMVPFKFFFLDPKKAPHPRVTNSQKCLRVSGKHNDLDEVGVDGYHHTMFEMLGNWSFGDYFKEEAIVWAWELITKIYQINPEDIYATVFEGDAQEQIPFDQESYDLWRKFLPAERVLKAGKKDNFWEMGSTGPCGPCSELHLDMRPEAEKKQVPGRLRVNQDDPYVIEIWNLVFIEFHRMVDRSLQPLPQKHVDTGMGLERLCRAIQGTKSNYTIDLFQPLIQKLSALSDKSYKDSDSGTDVAFRVIVDHIRAVAHALIDGQPFSNTGAGYVIRRILRRAVRYGYSYLHFREPFFWQLVRPWQQVFGEVFPEVKSTLGKTSLEDEIRREEELFFSTLDRGMLRLDAMLDSTRDKEISGALVFELYDTYGFPADMTAQILGERGRSYDQEGYQLALQSQKNRSREASKKEEGAWIDEQGRDILKGTSRAEISDFFKQGEQHFLGYDQITFQFETPVKPLAVRKVSTQSRQLYHLIFSKTPFYAEAGGQIGDIGRIHFKVFDREGTLGDEIQTWKVVDVQNEAGLTLHAIAAGDKELKGFNTPESLFQVEVCQLEVDPIFRREVSRHHTATHLLHQTLCEVLGSHVSQKGSKVSDRGLRFDFSHYAKLTEEEVQLVGEKVNQMIRKALPLEEQRSVPYNEALAQGAKALFDEKYGDNVRTVRFGPSLELCGGTHVTNTSELGFFHIVSESAVGSGVRRIEAIVSQAAYRYFQEQNMQISQLKTRVKVKDFYKGIDKLVQSELALKKKVKSLETFCIKSLKKDLWAGHEVLSNGVRFVFGIIEYLDMQAIKSLVFDLAKHDRTVVLLASKATPKVFLNLGVSKELNHSNGLSAAKLIKDLAAEIQGSGGGHASMATAGGTKSEGIELARKKLLGFLKSLSLKD